MRKFLFIFTILIWICNQAQIRATPQAGERIIIGKDTLVMQTCPIESDSVLQKKIQQYVSSNETWTCCWRGYIGIWRLQNNKLFLEKILNNSGMKPYTYISIDSIFDDYKDKQGRIVASWFSGKLRIIKGKQLKRFHYRGDPVYEYEIICQLKSGTIEKKKRYHNTLKPASISLSQALSIINDNFNKDMSLPELIDRYVRVRVALLSDKRGKIDSLNVELQIENEPWKKYAPDHPYMKELKRCFDLIPDWEVAVIYGKLDWEEFYMNLMWKKRETFHDNKTY